MTPPIPPTAANPHFLLGNVPEFMKNPLQFLIKNEKLKGDIYMIKSPFRKVCVINHPDYIKYVLQENHRNYTKSFGYDAMRPLLGNGLLTSTGDFWIRQRRLAQPAFHKERLTKLIDYMAESTREMLDSWQSGGEWMDIGKEMNKLALVIVSRAMFQQNIREDVIHRVSESLTVVLEGGSERIRNPFKLPGWIPTPQNIREKRALNDLNDVVNQIIDSRLKDQARHNDLLDMLIHTRDEETGEGMSREQLRDEVMTIFMAGHETTANALTFAVYLLATHPAEMKKLQEEANHVLGVNDPSFETMKELKYTRMVVDETLRLYPPAWIVGRLSLRDEQLGGYHIPAGTTMACCSYVLQHRDNLWQNPHEFIPERFDEHSQYTAPKYAYFPFGGGPRLCIGNMFAIYEMQVALSMMFRQFSFSLKPGYQMEVLPHITLRPKNPLLVSINPTS